MSPFLKIGLCLVVVSVSLASAQEKRNTRDVPKRIDPVTSDQTTSATYFYEFDRPGFIYHSVRIEHDADGRGRITFKRDGSDEAVEDPIVLSRATLDKIDAAFSALNFIDSSADYQTKIDHSNMGNVTIGRKVGGKARTVKFNWTDNKDAKVLMDEYRRISNEYTWRFEMVSARQNQPLLTPGLVDSLDRLIQRGEISDPPVLLPFLTELASDERLPLMARNHASKLIKQLRRAK